MAVWWWIVVGRGESSGARGETLAALRAETERTSRALEQLRGRLDTLRARLDDSEKVDQSVRAQLLGLDERTRLLEETLTRISDQRLSAHGTLALDEAEWLLDLGRQRLMLTHDAAAALVAYRLADAALRTVDDAAFSTVRQSLHAEITALTPLAAFDPAALLGRLVALQERVPRLPPVHAPAPESADTSRLARLLGALVRVRSDDDPRAALFAADVQLARELLLTQLATAQAALGVRDAANWRAALAAAHTVLAQGFDPAAADTAAVRAELDALAAVELAPAAPANLGAALTELRNLRAAHALRDRPRPSAAGTSGSDGSP
jgi:uroporphyrin-3 C-methyltransferase